jgi:hypothetical protein
MYRLILTSMVSHHHHNWNGDGDDQIDIDGVLMTGNGVFLKSELREGVH